MELPAQLEPNEAMKTLARTHTNTLAFISLYNNKNKINHKLYTMIRRSSDDESWQRGLVLILC